ncbi:hypothetical protein MBLNU457_4992t1 [Dothideomycetes sp. NU457]
MSKRFAESEAAREGDRAYNKRQKPLQPPEQAVEIFSARQLQDLLVFKQDDVDQMRNGIASLKVILDAILYSDNEQKRGSQQGLLRDFLDASKPKDTAALYLPDLMQAWSFAVQTGNEKLSTAVSSILALLLKTISGQLDLRDYGALLCRTLLQRDQIKLFSRGLSAEAHKDHLISPCLRALTEIVSFDGGAFAYQVFERQDSTFNSKFLDRNLRLFKTSGDEDRRKVSVRSNAVRYLLANIRYQPVVNRIRILEYRNLFRTLFDNLKNDSFEVVRDVLRSVEAHILRDQEIPRRSKTAIITEKAMISILEVARSEENTESPEGQSSRRKEALSFLMKVSTNRDLGVLLSQGWYPPGSDKDDDDEEDAMDNDDFDMEDYTTGQLANVEVPIRNSILSRFLQALRPHADLDERELGLAIFQATPELVADYLYQGRNRFSLEPKLTNTWIGYASFFFSLVELPVPSHFGHGKEYSSKPPPPRIVMENILPSPLSQKVMTRCLNQSSDLIVLFAVRLLSIALEKFGRVTAMYRNISQEHSSYAVAIQKLTAEVQDRLPLFKDLVGVTRKAADNNMVLREASTRLVRIYQQTMPQAAAEETFDVAARLTALLERKQEQGGETTDDSKLLRDLEMQHLLAIAGQSSGMRWWNKQGNLRFSPFTVLLQLSARASSSALLKNELEALLKTVACDNGILQAHTNPSAFSALRMSLSAHRDWSPSAATFNFIDECIGRLVKKPVKYMDDLDDIRPDADAEARKGLSMLVMACLEQAPFTSRMKSGEQGEILMWMARFFAALENIGEDEAVLKAVRKKLQSQKIELPKVAADQVVVLDSSVPVEHSTSIDKFHVNDDHGEPSTQGASFALTEAAEESESRPELRRWQNLDIEDAIQDGVAGRLAVCLCSKYPEIRKQGLTALRGMWKKFPESGYEGKEQADLLVGELIETASGIIDERPMSYIGGSFATHALQVLTDPTHFMFPKVNRYLLKDPTWNIRRLPDYWLGKTILEMPEDDNTYWKELMWVLDMLVDGVRTIDDVGVLRSRNVFERLLALSSSPSAGHAVRERVALLVFRSICAGGATLLVTSCGLVSWLGVQRSSGMLNQATVNTLANAIEVRIDTVKVEEWAGAQLKDELETLRGAAITA